jgi:hypothetical protein
MEPPPNAPFCFSNLEHKVDKRISVDDFSYDAVEVKLISSTEINFQHIIRKHTKRNITQKYIMT